MPLPLFSLFFLSFGLIFTSINTESYKHPCYRECNGEEMICKYEFNVSMESTMNLECGNCPFSQDDCSRPGCMPGGGLVRTVVVVNNQLPGPPIIVCENDTVIVKVTNNLRSQTTSIHWHGIHQVGTFFMDGLPQISQFPIFPTDSFDYAFKASPHGTHMWHGHSSFQESDGLYGAFIVRRKEPAQIKALYDFDLAEHIISVWHWYNQSSGDVLIPILQRNESVHGFGFLINGNGALKNYGNDDKKITTPKQKFTVQKGFRYRFRLLSNGVIYCPVQISVDSHNLTMFASETSYFEPVEADSFMVGAGDRFDFVLNASKEEGCYVMRFRGLGDCGPPKGMVHEEAFICYGNATNFTVESSYQKADRNGLLLNPVEEVTSDYKDKQVLHLHELNSIEAAANKDYIGTPNITMYIELESRVYENARFPGNWHQFNNVTFRYPEVSFLRERFMSNELCTEETKQNFCEKDFCTCVYYKEIPKDALVEIVLIDVTGIQDHPVHLHGYMFNIVAMEAIGPNISFTDIKNRNEKGLIKKNLKNAISKDTVSVPNRGYAILRFKASNPGYWLLHCHVTNHLELGMGMLLKIGSVDEIMSMCHHYKQCGQWSSSTSLNSNLFSLIIALPIIVYTYISL